MSPTFKSGAFAQQCFSSHPLCLNLKKLELPEKVILACTACNMRHRLTVRVFTVRAVAPLPPAAEAGTQGGAVDQLAQCAAAHPAALGVRAMDVVNESVGLRCAECRRSYDLEVSVFETHQR